MAKWEVSSLQAGMLVAGAVALTGHALAVTHFIAAGGRDAWMSGLLSLPAAAFSAWCFVRLGRIFPDKTVVQYLPKMLGYLGYPLSTLYLVYYLAVVVFTLRMTTDWLVDSILPETPGWVMGGLYTAAILYTAAGGLDVLARLNQFTLPLLTLLGMLVAFATMPAKDYRLLTPMMEHGFGPLASVTFLGLGYFGETSILAMLQPYVRRSDRPKLLTAYLLALLFVATTLTGPLAGSVATLGYRVAENMAYPTFQHWLLVSFARFFERTDLLAVHQWLAGAYVRCGLFLLMVAKGAVQLSRRDCATLTWPLVVSGALAFGLAEWAFPDKTVFDWWVRSVLLPTGALLGIVTPPVLLALAWMRGLHRKPQGQAHGA